ncbi:MAG TPA: hypothetical protein VF275_07075 [Gammaproteobacteria bacterium]
MDIVGWVFVVFAGFGVLAGILQNLMLHLLFPDGWQDEIAAGAVQVGAGFEIFQYFELIAGAALMVAILMLLAAIGLLRRRNWARLTFIGILCLGILWNIASFTWQVLFFREMFVPPQAAGEFQQQFEVIHHVGLWMAGVFALMLSILFGWIAWKLTRTAIKAEFKRSVE